MKRQKSQEIRFRIRESDPLYEQINGSPSPSEALMRLASIGARWQKADQDPVAFILMASAGAGIPVPIQQLTQTEEPPTTASDSEALAGPVVHKEGRPTNRGFKRIVEILTKKRDN